MLTIEVPPLPSVVNHHPSSVDNLLLESLMRKTPRRSVAQFLQRGLSCISKDLSNRLVKELGKGFADEDLVVGDLKKKQIHHENGNTA